MCIGYCGDFWRTATFPPTWPSKHIHNLTVLTFHRCKLSMVAYNPLLHPEIYKLYITSSSNLSKTINYYINVLISPTCLKNSFEQQRCRLPRMAWRFSQAVVFITLPKSHLFSSKYSPVQYAN